MRCCPWSLALLFCTLLAAGPVWGAPADDEGPSAVQVMVRGKKHLVDALEAAARPAWADGCRRPVLIVVDVTPPTQKAQDEIARALAALEDRAAGVPSWSIAALGEKPTKPAPTAGALGPLLDRVLAKETDVVSTLTCLRRTLKAWKAKKGVVVYLADWRFEDDLDLEDFIRDLGTRGRTLSVVGTEAAFGRAWNDGFRDLGERLEYTRRGTRFTDYWENVGRDPFRNKNANAPWHGGDTAYPYAPYRWDRLLWKSAFSQSDWDLADLDADLDDARESALGGPLFRRIILVVELADIQRRLDEAEPGSAEAKDLEERKQAIETEIAELEKQEASDDTDGADDPVAEPEADAHIESLERQLADVNAELDALLPKLLATDDPEQTKELQDEHERLSANAARLAAEIEKRRAELDAEFERNLDDDLGEPETEIQALERQLADVNAEIDALLRKLLATDDPEETKGLQDEHDRLSANAARLAADIEKQRAELHAEFEKLDEELDEQIEEAKAELEELKRRLPGESTEPEEEDPPWVDSTMDRYREFPLPSSFGPYGLVRAAGVTGGRYVLWSWNPSGRKNVVLEYTRCNLFPPDLRSRKAILSDLKKNPWAQSLIRAWWTIVEARTEILEHTPPLRANLRSPAPMQCPNVLNILSSIWQSPSEQKQYVKYALRAIDALDEAIGQLDEGLEKGGEPRTPVQCRYQAEVYVFRHAAKVVRFELAECIAASKLIDRRAWRDRQDHGISTRAWVEQGRDPERVRARAGVLPFDPAAGQPLIEERKALLERFRGTPFGEQIALNEIQTARPASWERWDKGPGTGRSPTESVEVEIPKPKPKPPGGGSGPGGPTTGGD